MSDLRKHNAENQSSHLIKLFFNETGTRLKHRLADDAYDFVGLLYLIDFIRKVNCSFLSLVVLSGEYLNVVRKISIKS